MTTGLVVIAGEVTTQRVRAASPSSSAQRILDIGYDSSTKGFDGASCGVQVCIGSQSVDIAQGVDQALGGALGAARSTHSTARAPATRA